MTRSIKFICLFASLLHFSDPTIAQLQSEQSNYLKAKEYFDQGEYVFAMYYFRKLASTNQKLAFKDYASFYYALSAYKNGDISLAKSMWLQMATKNKKWENIDDVYYWLAQVYFEAEDHVNEFFMQKSLK